MGSVGGHVMGFKWEGRINCAFIRRCLVEGGWRQSSTSRVVWLMLVVVVLDPAGVSSLLCFCCHIGVVRGM